MPHREQPICNRKAQVVFIELDESGVQLRRSAHTARKCICLKLEPSAQHCQTERQQLQKEKKKLNMDQMYLLIQKISIPASEIAYS